MTIWLETFGSLYLKERAAVGNCSPCLAGQPLASTWRSPKEIHFGNFTIFDLMILILMCV
jgi:hypothetical protein